MRNTRNYIFVITLLVGLTAVITKPISAQGQTVIDFEGLSPSGNGVKITDQYKDKGIIFSNATATDSSGVNGFAHSGKNLVESCLAIEHCSSPISMTFTKPQKRIKVWVGFAYPGKYTIYLQGFTGGKINPKLKSTIVVKEPYTLNRSSSSTLSGYQMFAIEVVSDSNNIVRAEVGFLLTSASVSYRPLAIDDVEFQRVE